MSVPVLVLGEGLVDAVIEVLVVGEDNVATDIVQLERTEDCRLVIVRFCGAQGELSLGDREVNIRSPQGSHQWKQDHRGSRWSR
jgi:hypothetical protein